MPFIFAKKKQSIQCEITFFCHHNILKRFPNVTNEFKFLVCVSTIYEIQHDGDFSPNNSCIFGRQRNSSSHLSRSLLHRNMGRSNKSDSVRPFHDLALHSVGCLSYSSSHMDQLFYIRSDSGVYAYFNRLLL